MVIGGDAAVLMNDSRPARRSLEFLATPEAAEVWAEPGGFISPNKNVAARAYPDETTRAIAEAARRRRRRRALRHVRPGAGRVRRHRGRGEWKVLQDFLPNPSDVDGTAAAARGGGHEGVRVGERGAADATEASADATDEHPVTPRGAAPRSAARPPSAAAASSRARRRASSSRSLFLAARAAAARRAGRLPDRVHGRSGACSTPPATSFVGARQLRARCSATPRRCTALRNNAIWVVVAPTLATGLGLVFAVLTERVRWETAFKLVVFMPMAISFLAAGMIFRSCTSRTRRRGVPTRWSTERRTTPCRPPGAYAGARAVATGRGAGRATAASSPPAASAPGDAVTLGLVASRPTTVPRGRPAGAREPRGAGRRAPRRGLARLHAGRRRRRARSTRPSRGCPASQVEARRGDGTVAAATTDDRRRVRFARPRPAAATPCALPASNFREPFTGRHLARPRPGDPGDHRRVHLDLGRVRDGADRRRASPPSRATRWRPPGWTAPTSGRCSAGSPCRCSAPVLLVVLVTLVINVLKIFDLVFVIAPGSSQDDANVLALEMWRVSFGGAHDQGLGQRARRVLLFCWWCRR